ncbi:hypothetical protein ACHAPE_002954 [Trichoderma viride]
MTEFPDTDEFYGQMETFVALTHCNHHCVRALNAFTAWKAKRQAALSSPPFPSSANEVSNNQQNDNSSNILHDSTSIYFADPISIEDEAEEEHFISSDDSDESGDWDERNDNMFQLVERAATDKELFLHSGENSDHGERTNLGDNASDYNVGEQPQSYSKLKNEEAARNSLVSNEIKLEQENRVRSLLGELTKALDISFEQAVAFQEKVSSNPTDETFGKSLALAQEVQANIIAPPATDSGYGSTSATESKLGLSMRHTDVEQPTQATLNQDMDDTATEYSDESRSTFSKKQGFVRELANELFKAVGSSNATEIIRARVSTILPELLQAFALKVGYGAKTQMHRDVMAFVYRYRREIATEFTDMSFKKDLNDSTEEKRKAEGMSWQDRTSLWFEKASFEALPEEPSQLAGGDGEAVDESFPDEDEELPDSWLTAYRTFLTSNSAYEELLARLQREFYLVPAKLNIMGEIRKTIMASLPSPHKMSRKISPPNCRASFLVNWDIIDFFTTQGYVKEPYDAFEGVITITGTCQDAQAATCAQYIKQTWPITGEIVIRLIKDVLKGAGHVQLYNLSSEQAEVQLPSTVSVFDIEFAMEVVPQTLPAANGQCWHDILRNPVVVRGYPIPQRLERNTGLEISLNVMAGLARAQRVNRFKEKVYIKGFSTMLVPTKKNTDIICWHLIYNRNGEHISYLDDDQDQEQYIGQLDLENYRHVLGWCSEAKLYAGSAGAHHPVTHSRLPKPHPDCALYGMRVLEGKLILNGPEFFIGAKDTPEHIARKGNIRRLKWMSTKFVLLWDDRDKRGWLINGTTALLHIVRAFLSHAKEDNFKSAFQLNDEDLQEAKVPFTADSAIAVLLNPVNRRLKLYDEDEGDDDEYLLKTQIDHFYNILEQLIEYQADIAGLNGSKLGNSPRKFLEGWDFEDMAKECPTIYPRVATIGDAGKGWVDFVRAIHAVTIVGRGFGDIIRPTGRDHCDSWATLPTKRYYIASCVSDLDRLLKEAGSHQDGHDLLCDNLIYHAPASVYLPCQCRVTPGRKHCEPVRTLIPSAMSTAIPFRKSVTKPQELGAVILGYSSHFPLIWGDTGSPQLGKLLETEAPSKETEENVDSGFGSNSTGSELESHSVPHSESETENSAMLEEIRPETAKRVVSHLRTPIGNDKYTRSHYTVGIICPLAKELRAVRALFDNEHGSLILRSDDSYPYVLGDMAGHWVVAACLPEYGTNSAATLALDMKFNFSSIRFCLIVGIAGGVPSKETDVRLGDVVVSYPTGTSPGVVQYDLGKENDGNQFQRMGSLQRPPLVPMAAINTLQSDLEPPDGQLGERLGVITHRLPDYKYPGQDLDMPYQTACASCASHQAPFVHVSCSHIQQRSPRTTTLPAIHYGVIASGNRVIKDATLRNQLAQEHGMLCFEMEAAGMMNTLDCLVIRGISDYCDGQKNDSWQKYAAATAAAYAKLLLRIVPRGKRSGAGSTERI